MKLDKVAIWDTYITEQNGNVLHFDIVVPEETEESKVKKYLEEFIKQKGISGNINSSKCSFCHIEKATDEQENSILKHGFYIIPISGFNNEVKIVKSVRR